MVKGKYKTIWSAPVDGRELPCEREPGNARDALAVAIRSSGDLTVGHVPRLISAICSIFIRRGGSLVCVVTGSRQYSADLPQGGLEVPCQYIFRTSNQAESDKTRKLIETVLAQVLRFHQHQRIYHHHWRQKRHLLRIVLIYKSSAPIIQ